MNHPAFDPAFVQRIVGALLHFIWQGAAIAAIAAIGLRLMSRASAEARYLVSLAGLAAMLAAPILTFFLYDRIGRVTLNALIWLSDGYGASAVAMSPAFMYWIVGLWSAGVLGCLGRLIVAWRVSCRLLRVATSQAPAEIAALFDLTAAAIGIDVLRKRIRLFVSGVVDSPAVVGWIRPAILLPVSAMTGLRNDQLRAVLAHELAHVRRHDFLVNTVQMCVESLLFYHPAVWWLSGRVRAERENCCDDVAVRVCGDRRLYVQALVELERARPRIEALAMSAAGGILKERVQRLLGFQNSAVDWRSLVVTLGFVCAWIASGLYQPALSGSEPPIPETFRQPAQLAAVLPPLPSASSSAAAVVRTVAAIATAQPVVAEPQLPGQSGAVTGVLRTSSGVPLEGISIAVSSADLSTRILAQGLTDSAGRYRLAGVSAGRYHILIGENRRRFVYPGVSDMGQATAIQVTAGETLEVPDTVVSGGPVTGRVLDIAAGHGRRVENLALCCDYFREVRYSPLGGPKQGSPFWASMSDDGSFIFPFVPAGNYVLSIVERNERSLSWALAVGPNGLTGVQLDLIEGVNVQGTVLDQIGEPVAASVRLIPGPGSFAFNRSGSPTYSGPRPTLFLIGSQTGPARVFLRGILVPRAYPSMEDIQNLNAETSTGRSATAGPDGRFEFRGVQPGAYSLEVNSGGTTFPRRDIQVGIGGLTNLSFQVPAVQVTGRVIAAGGGRLPTLNYIRLVRSSPDGAVFYGFPDTEGHFTIQLLPGQYRVFTERLGPSVQSISDGSRDISNAELAVETGRRTELVVTLTP